MSIDDPIYGRAVNAELSCQAPVAFSLRAAVPYLIHRILCEPCAFPSSLVHGCRYRLQMFWAHAVPHSAQMIELQALRYGAACFLIEISVSKNTTFCLWAPHLCISGAWITTSDPHPARRHKTTIRDRVRARLAFHAGLLVRSASGCRVAARRPSFYLPSTAGG
jgi:hypothetical protein